MNQFAILHRPMSEDAHGIDSRRVVIRLRAARADLKRCTLFFGDRACRQTPVLFTAATMEIVAQDNRFDYFEVTLKDAYLRLCYYFVLDDGAQQIYYYGDFFDVKLVDDRSEYFQLPYNRPEDIAAPPEWAQDAVIYNIFPDSFASGKDEISLRPCVQDWNGLDIHGKLGGTIRGITQNVEYLKKLGVTAIYINPIFVAGEYHKYDLLDYFHVDPCFGTDEEFRELVEIYHKNGLRVLIDGVFNHCGWKFFAFEDVVQNGENSRYKDWFYRLTFPIVRPEDWDTYPNYECFGYERMMPKMNTSNKEVIQYFCDVAQHWIREYDIDGWRLDVASEVDDGFWRAFCRSVKDIKGDALVIGEVWESAQHWLEGDMFDSSMNYDFRKHCRRFFGEQSIDAYEFDGRVTNMRMRYRQNMLYAQLNLLDSHDVSRFLSLCDKDVGRFRLAVLFQMTFQGMPSIFYGDEQGLFGVSEEEYRHPMIWDGNQVLFTFYQRAIALRKEEIALRRGTYRTISAEADSYLYAFYREWQGERILVALNMGDTSCTMPHQDTGMNVLWCERYTDGILQPKGFVILK